MSTGKDKGWQILNPAQARFIEGYFNLDKAMKKDPEVLIPNVQSFFQTRRLFLIVSVLL